MKGRWANMILRSCLRIKRRTSWRKRLSISIENWPIMPGKVVVVVMLKISDGRAYISNVVLLLVLKRFLVH